MDEPLQNTSGQGKNAEIPAEIRGWNWGAFFLNWIWGIANGSFIALLMFVPLLNFIMPFILGAKGNQWAWQNRIWRDTAHFKSVQRKWAVAGLIIFVVIIPSCISLPITMMRSSEAFKISFAAIQENPAVIQAMGEPLSAGWFVTGSINSSGPNGSAALNYSISGPKAEGRANVYANKFGGQWGLHTLNVILANGQVIWLVPAKQTNASQHNFSPSN